MLPLEIVLNGVKSMVFYTSNNGGETWKHGPGIQGVEASRTAWLNARSGWALQAGGKLLATDDGGVSWKQATKGSAFDKATEIQFSTSRTGWISGPEILWSTADGGHTWRNLLLPS
ncbi:WD40/YVTN/BNR-like repeat-containing protein [Paenibacillus sp. sgz500992]|uniref:WD40/YVTN/BNR-like repeat-containing protein n=1 Tax=Paenibacillus sp. sgz500992 TaxID=3242476 RepID=UPI0036D33B64